MKSRNLRPWSLILSGLFGAISLNVHAGAALGIFNPFNHGLDGVNELGTERVVLAYPQLFPSLGMLADTGFTSFAPYYSKPATHVYEGTPWSLDNYNSHGRQYQDPFQSP